MVMVVVIIITCSYCNYYYLYLPLLSITKPYLPLTMLNLAPAFSLLSQRWPRFLCASGRIPVLHHGRANGVRHGSGMLQCWGKCLDMLIIVDLYIYIYMYIYVSENMVGT